MAGRLAAVLDRLEAGDQPAPDPGSASYFDLTRWRRRPRPDIGPVDPESLGDRLRQRRLQLGLSQAEVGELFGVGRATVYRWERGLCRPPASCRAAFVTFLGCVLQELLPGLTEW
jgi:DNA-binding XRE family transcriptional regulator